MKVHAFAKELQFKENQVWLHRGRGKNMRIENVGGVEEHGFYGILSDVDGCTVHGFFKFDEFETFIGYDCMFPALPSYTEAIINFVKNPSEESEKVLRLVSKYINFAAIQFSQLH